MKNKAFENAAKLALILWLLMTSTAGATSYTLTVSAQGSGTVARNPTNSSYPSGVTVIVTAAPDAGWYFVDWSGDVTGTINPTNVTVNSNMVITGNFLPFPTYTLTLVTNGQGTIALNPAGGSYMSNSVVTATATPAAGWVFTSWSGSMNSSANPLSLTVNSNLSLTGTFAQLPAFDLQPRSVTNVVGSTVSFSSHAAGNLPLGYQWFFSGGPLIHATGTTLATLTLTNVLPGQAGNYWVTATNSCGSATSSVVSLILTNVGGSTNMVYSSDEASLRAAIKIGGWVSLAFNGTITLTNTINITNNVILDGQNFSATISGGNAVRLFYIAPGASLSATNLTLANGSCIITNGSPGTPADAGAIYNDGGTVTLVACTLTNNNAQSLIFGGLARGGAIFNNGGTLSLCQSAVLNNAVISGALGNPILSAWVTNLALGGAIYNTNGSVTIVGCDVRSNHSLGMGNNYNLVAEATGSSMGGAVFQASGSFTVSNSIFILNNASGGGLGGSYGQPANPAYGGALAANGGSLTIDHSQFFSNTAKGGDSGNSSHGTGGSAYGGAVYSAAVLTVRDDSFFGNQTLGGNNSAYSGPDAYGGGIYNSGTAVLNRCSVYSNYVQGGSGSWSVMMGPGIGGNGLGGGIFNASQFAATNCTIALNSVLGGNGSSSFPFPPAPPGAGGNAMGGGVFNDTTGTFIAMNLTLASNSCSSPSGSSFTNRIAAGTQIANTNGTLSLHNSLIAGTNGNAYGTITDIGYNICSDGSANLNSGSSYNFTDPQLASLGNYGGPTLCMALLPNSPAIDLGDSSGAPSTDQRGFIRPFGDGVDGGTFEYGSYQLDPPAGVLKYLDITAAANCFLITFTGPAANAYRLQASTNLLTWIDLNTNGPFASSTNITQVINRQDFNRCFFRMLVQ